MAFTLNNYVGFETQKFEELDAVTGTPTFETTNQRTSGAAIVLTNGQDIRINAFDHVSDAGDRQGIGFAFRFPTSIGTTDLVVAREGTTQALKIEIFDDFPGKKIRVKDSANGNVISWSNALSADTWYYVELVWEHTDSAEATLYMDGVQVGTPATGRDLSAGGTFDNYFFNPSRTIWLDDIYIASGLTAASDLLGDFEVFMRQTSVTGTTATAGLLGNAERTLDAGGWEDVAETPGTDAQPASYNDEGYGIVDLDALGADIDGDSNIKAIKGIWRAARSGGGGTTHTLGLGVASDGDSATSRTQVLTTSITSYLWMRTTDLPLSTDTLRQGMGMSNAQDFDLYEMWAMIAHVPSAGGITTEKAINITFTTAMVNTHFKIGVLAANVGFATAMSLERKTGKLIPVAFGTGITVAKKTTPTAKTVSFVTSMATTPIKIGVKAINVAFGTAFSLGKTTKLAKAVSFATAMALSKVSSFFRAFSVGFSTAFGITKKVSTTKTVAFVTSMALTPVRTVVKAIAFALGTAFTNARTIKLTKAVSFVTGMARSTVSSFFRTFNVAFGTSMSLSAAKTILKSIAVGFTTAFAVVKKVSVTKAIAFVTTMSLATLFIEGVALFTKTINVAFVTTVTVAKKVSVFKDVAFVTAMALTKFKLVPKAIAFAFATAFTVVRTTKLTKAVDFVTAMVLTRFMSFFRTINVAFGTAFAVTRMTQLTKAVSFITSMALTRNSLFFRAFNVAFVTAMSTTAVQLILRTFNVAFTTAMSTTPVPTFVRVFNVAFGTTMSLAKTVRKNIAVAFVTAFAVARKTSVTKAVAFVTTFALTTAFFFVKALSVSFITTMALTKTLSLSQAFSVTFTTSMSLVKKVLKTFTVGFSTGFGLAKLIRVTKPVAFVTSMTRTTVLSTFVATAVAFVTTMVTTASQVILKSVGVGFVTTFAIATRFISGIIVPTGAMLLFMRRRRWGRKHR